MSSSELLLSLPNETIRHICRYLNNYQIQCLAQTFNRRITVVCLHWLVEYAQVLRLESDSKIVTLFGKVVVSLDYNFTYCEKVFDLAITRGKISCTFSLPPRAARLSLYDYLHLNGRLQWLQPLQVTSKPAPPSTRRRKLLHFNAPATGTIVPNAPNPEFSSKFFLLSKSQMDFLEQATLSLGVALPRAFVRFMSDADLQRRITPTSREDVNNWLVKVDPDQPATLVNGTPIILDGYLFQFYEETREKAHLYWYLYMDRDGDHGVLSSNHNFHEPSDHLKAQFQQRWHHSSAAARPAMPPYPDPASIDARLTPTEISARCQIYAPDQRGQFRLKLWATSFEEFLVPVYFEGYARRYLYQPAPGKGCVYKIPEHLIEYLLQVFSAEGRKPTAPEPQGVVHKGKYIWTVQNM